MSQVQMVALPGSTRRAVPNVKLTGKADPAKKIRVSVYVRRNPDEAVRAAKMTESFSGADLSQRRYLSRDDAARTYGADAADVEAVTHWAKRLGLTAVNDPEESARTRRILLEGTIGAFEKAFLVELNTYRHPRYGEFRGRDAEIHVPAFLQSIVDGVFGLDTRRVGRARHRVLNVRPQKIRAVQPTTQWPGTFFPPQVAELYEYPRGTDGAGQNVAIFAFNGDGPHGYGGYRETALSAYFEMLGGSAPSIADVVVSGPGNNPGPDTPASDQQGDATGEVMLDMCVVGSVAPRAKIFMYFTEFTEQGWIDALHQAITDDNDIDVISISYGNPEDDPEGAWTAAGVKQVNLAFEPAAARGITICCAAGDDGSADQVSKGAHTDFPASSPYVLAVGGTKLVASSATAIASEVVWNELRHNEGSTGGGISAIFSKPSYQDSVSVPPSANPPHRVGRGVPDVAAVADPLTGVVIATVGGQLEPIGGTSAAAPMWASLIARLNEATGVRCGFFNPVLYGKASTGILRDITRGNNGAYSAAPGWDACTGLGTPNGQALLKVIQGNAPSTKATPDFGLWQIKFDPEAPSDSLFLASGQAELAAARVVEAAEIPWPAKWAPTPAPLRARPSANAPLPKADVLLVTWTTGEARTMATLMTGANYDDWYEYRHNVATFEPKVTGGQAPFNDADKDFARYYHSLGLYFPCRVGDISVLAVKSGLHMAYDGPDVPVVDLWRQMITEVQPKVIITTGTGGGIGQDVLLGDVVIAAATRFDLTAGLKSKPFAQSSYATSKLDSTRVAALATDLLLKPNGARLATPRTPRVIYPGVPDANVVTTDTFAFDDSTDHFGLQGLGKCCDMGDAALGFALDGWSGGKGRSWFSIRNASDPQIANPNNDIRGAQSEAEQIYSKYQMVTTAGSIVASWAVIVAQLSPNGG
jgi:kumamolisin